MKTITNNDDKIAIVKRIRNLTPESKALWGKMNASQMICHVSDQIKMAVGIRQVKFIGNLFLTTIGKWAVFAGMPAPKGKIDTLKELKQGAGGTTPGNFEDDRNELIKLINEFESLYPVGKKIMHGAFGSLNFKQWGKLTYTHLDYHLRQFDL